MTRVQLHGHKKFRCSTIRNPPLLLFSRVCSSIILRQPSFYRAASVIDRSGKFAEAGQRLVATGLARTALLLASAEQIGRHQHVRGRGFLPVLEQVIYVPQCERVNFAKRPPGGSGDVAVEKRPLRYTATGVGSPEAAFFRPETSSTALKSALKSSSVRPFSICSGERS